MPKDPRVAAKLHAKIHPNCHVLVEWIDQDILKTAIELPYNITVDQLLVDEGDMSISRFTTKWYGKVSKAKLKAIEKELAKEFVEEEEEEVDKEMIIEVD
jgi:ferritin-like protein